MTSIKISCSFNLFSSLKVYLDITLNGIVYLDITLNEIVLCDGIESNTAATSIVN